MFAINGKHVAELRWRTKVCYSRNVSIGYFKDLHVVYIKKKLAKPPKKVLQPIYQVKKIIIVLVHVCWVIILVKGNLYKSLILVKYF